MPDGGFHVKAAGLRLARLYVAAKINANFPDNAARHGLPTIQGVVALSDGETGRPLALLDSMEITALRTGAATAVAARHLARPEARVATIVGCGRQGRIQLAALARVRPLERVHAVDADPALARRFAAGDVGAARHRRAPGRIGVAEAAPGATSASRARRRARPLLVGATWRPGTFIAAVGRRQRAQAGARAGSDGGRDHRGRQPRAVRRHRRSPPRARARARSPSTEVHAELAQVVAGQKPGRTSAEEITIFDSTGVAIEDVAAAAVVYEKAIAPAAASRWIWRADRTRAVAPRAGHRRGRPSMQEIW